MAAHSMRCIRCGASNPAGHRYCGSCGAVLDADAGPLQDLIDTVVRQQVAEAAAEQFKNQKVIEHELTDAVTTRLSTWAKFYVGIPLGILLTALGILGYDKLASLDKLVDDAKKGLEPRLKQAKEQATKLNKDIDNEQAEVKTLISDGNSLKLRLRELETQLAQHSATVQRVADLENILQLLPAIKLNIFDGRRQPIPNNQKVLVRIVDGNQRQVSGDYRAGPSIMFPHLPLHNNFDDNHTVIISAPGYRSTGYTPLHVSKLTLSTLDLMLLPNSATFRFAEATWKHLQTKRPTLAATLRHGAQSETAAQQRYTNLVEKKPDSVAMLLNIMTALAQIQLLHGTAADYIKEVIWDSVAIDRFSTFADPMLLADVKLASQHGAFALEVGSAIFHPGATASYKEIQFGEANVTSTFYERDARIIDGRSCIKVEFDMDYYKDLAAHTLTEVSVGAQRGNLLNPLQVYQLRWMAGRRIGSEFNPLYTVE